MRWFVFVENYGLVFDYPDDTKGKDEVMEFLTETLPRDYGVDADEDSVWVVRGEEHQFVPPADKGKLVKVKS